MALAFAAGKGPETILGPLFKRVREEYDACECVLFWIWTGYHPESIHKREKQ